MLRALIICICVCIFVYEAVYDSHDSANSWRLGITVFTMYCVWNVLHAHATVALYTHNKAMIKFRAGP